MEVYKEKYKQEEVMVQYSSPRCLSFSYIYKPMLGDHMDTGNKSQVFWENSNFF